MNKMRCIACGNSNFTQRTGCARDNSLLIPLECNSCGLVRLSSFDHIDNTFYAESHMHDDAIVSPELELQQNEADVQRRMQQWGDHLANKTLLDVGCGAGGFLLAARGMAANAVGIEPEKRLQPHFAEHALSVYPSLESLPASALFEVITMFHVLEHIPDPVDALRNLKRRLQPGSTPPLLIVEVPSANDALLTLYKNKDFSSFTYWSCHLYMFTEDTLRRCAEKAGLCALEMRQFQRYPLANHLHWLAEGKPGGQHIYTAFNNHALNEAYTASLEKKKLCDTIIGVFTTHNNPL